jgi:hypothetical protein
MSIALRRNVSATPTQEGMVLLDERASTYFQLNGTGARVLRSLLDGASVEAAAAELSACYPVSAEQAQADVTALIGSLSSAGLVTE